MLVVVSQSEVNTVVLDSQIGCSLRGMDVRMSIQPQQGAPYDDVLRVAKAACIRVSRHVDRLCENNMTPSPISAAATCLPLENDLGLCRPTGDESLAGRAISSSGRHNHEVGTIGVREAADDGDAAHTLPSICA